MKYLGFIFGILVFIGSILSLFAAKNAINEVSSAVGLLTGCVCIIGACILDELGTQRKRADAVVEASDLKAKQLTATLQQIANALASIDRKASFSVPSPKSSAKYFYSTKGEQEGPFTAEHVRTLKELGELSDETAVIREGDSEWRQFRHYPDLAMA